jgi:hypothetical protein
VLDVNWLSIFGGWPLPSGLSVLSRYVHRFRKWELADDQKSKIDREDTATWFNVFNIIFELVSAYGTVGLSLGSPIANYSLVSPLIHDLSLMIDSWVLGVHYPNLSSVQS